MARAGAGGEGGFLPVVSAAGGEGLGERGGEVAVELGGEEDGGVGEGGGGGEEEVCDVEEEG